MIFMPDNPSFNLNNRLQIARLAVRQRATQLKLDRLAVLIDQNLVELREKQIQFDLEIAESRRMLILGEALMNKKKQG